MGRQQSKRCVPTLHDVILSTALLAVRPCAASLNQLPPSRLQALASRATVNPEHVILADCKDDASGSLSSQMAYFPSAPNGAPQDVAVVQTPEGQTALWASTTTKGLFTDTDTTFIAVLGPKVDDGQFAGTGSNGYGNFTCWQQYTPTLYTYSGTTCSQVYDCNHSPPPANTSTAADASNAASSNTGLSVGAVVGIAVGVAGAFLLALAGALVLFLRRRSRRRDQGLSADSPETNRLRPSPPGSSAKIHGQYPGSASTNSPFGNPHSSDYVGYYGKQGVSEMGTHNYTFELDTRFQNAVPAQYEHGLTEMPIDGARVELHGDSIGMGGGGGGGYGYQSTKRASQPEQVSLPDPALHNSALHDPTLHARFSPTASEAMPVPQPSPGSDEHHEPART